MRVIQAGSGRVTALAFVAGGSLVALDQGPPPRVYRLDLATGEKEPLAPESRRAAAVAMACHPRRGLVAVQHSGWNLYQTLIHDLTASRAAVKLDTARWYPGCMAFTPDGTALLVAGYRYSGFLFRELRYSIRVYDTATGERMAEHAGTWPVHALAFDADGNTLAALRLNDYRIALYDYPVFTLRSEVRVPKPTDRNFSSFVIRGHTVVLAYGRWLQFWDVTTPLTPRQALVPGRFKARGLAFTPDGRQVLTVGGDRTVRVWNPDNSQEQFCLKWKLGPLWSVAVSPDGLLAAAGGEDGRAIVWDLEPS
jgi:WD40 repeat protein